MLKKKKFLKKNWDHFSEINRYFGRWAVQKGGFRLEKSLTLVTNVLNWVNFGNESNIKNLKFCLATGTSGGVSANDVHHHKRLRNIHGHHGGSGDGSGSGGGSGNGSGNSQIPPSRPFNQKDEYYKPTILTEAILLVHNRGMEKKMMEAYREGKRGEFRFLKNKFRTNRQSQNHQNPKRIVSAQHQFHHNLPELWRGENIPKVISNVVYRRQLI